MNLFIAVTILVSVSALVIIQTVRNFRLDALSDERSRSLPVILVPGLLLLMTDIVLGGEMMPRYLVDLTLILYSVIFLNSSLKPDGPAVRRAIAGIMVSECLLASCYVLSYMRVLSTAQTSLFLCLAVALSVISASFFLFLVWRRIYEIKALLKSGTVWAFVNLCVDAFYVLTQLMTVTAVMTLCAFIRKQGPVIGIGVMLLGVEVIASGLRIAFDSAFVIRHRHERVIVESMKISPGEIAGNSTKADEHYKDVYERVVLHFEMKKPFLNSELTINDVVKVVYSNKVYISRAICHFTGRNFRQFVNYHRVMYSMDAFRKQPSLKVTELANISGFNSVVSYTSAFRLFMNETPSEWCRKEKTRIIKTKI